MSAYILSDVGNQFEIDQRLVELSGTIKLVLRILMKMYVQYHYVQKIQLDSLLMLVIIIYH